MSKPSGSETKRREAGGRAARRAVRSRAAVAVGFACALLLVTQVATRAAAQHAIGPDDVEGPFAWGAATHVTHLSHLYFADQPDAEGFELARQAGVTTVIDLRAPDERDWDERTVVEGLGLVYHDVPVVGPDFDPKAFERIEALVAERPDEPILIHCSTSNRVGGWLATHLVTRHGMTESTALAVGRRAGITRQEIVDRVGRYLEAWAKAAPSGSAARPDEGDPKHDQQDLK